MPFLGSAGVLTNRRNAYPTLAGTVNSLAGVRNSFNLSSSASRTEKTYPNADAVISAAQDVVRNNTSMPSVNEYIKSAAAMSQANSAFNAAEAQKNRDWQERMSNTAHQREVADLLAAGLNPVLSVTGGSGASSGTGSQAVADSSANPAIAGMISSLLSSNATLSAAALASSASQYTAEVNNPLGTLLHGSATSGKTFLSLLSSLMLDEFNYAAGKRRAAMK